MSDPLLLTVAQYLGDAGIEKQIRPKSRQKVLANPQAQGVESVSSNAAPHHKQ